MTDREEFEKWLKNNNLPNHAGMWEAWQEAAEHMKEQYCSLSVEDWEELEKTINREKQLYTESDLKAAAERMKERCIERLEKMITPEEQCGLYENVRNIQLIDAIIAIQNLEVEG